MRYNDKHHNTCGNRIGMYREEQCTAGPNVCPFLSDCDEHWDPFRKEWTYGAPFLFTTANSGKTQKHTPHKNKRAGLHGYRRKCEALIDRIKVIGSPFTSRQLTETIGKSPISVSNYLRMIDGLEYNRKDGTYTVVGELKVYE